MKYKNYLVHFLIYDSKTPPEYIFVNFIYTYIFSYYTYTLFIIGAENKCIYCTHQLSSCRFKKRISRKSQQPLNPPRKEGPMKYSLLDHELQGYHHVTIIHANFIIKSCTSNLRLLGLYLRIFFYLAVRNILQNFKSVKSAH